MRQTMAYTVAVVLGIGVVWLGRSQPSESQPVPPWNPQCRFPYPAPPPAF
jgi:hypothetical protein